MRKTCITQYGRLCIRGADQYSRMDLTGYLDAYLSMTESFVMSLTGDAEDMTAYYAGREPALSDTIKHYLELVSWKEDWQESDFEWSEGAVRLYMTLMEEMGFCLYNRNIQKCDRTLEKLGLDEKEHDRAEKALIKDFIRRFGHSPKGLKEAGEETKQQVLDHYVSQRLIFFRLCSLLWFEVTA